ncbi:MAG: GMC family oxidoreductase [Porphyrobacter sp.]|nr:GMC family oxidoreductase [Porphyrobacter sp.]
MSRSEAMTVGVLVIGSGPGGCVSGTMLAEAGHDVLIVEEGEHLSLDAAAHFSRDEMLRKYRNGGVSVALGRQKLAWVEGRCVGGGSEVNRGLYRRTPEYVFESWRKDFGVDRIDSDSMKPHFAACEAIARVEYIPGTPSEMSQRLQRGAQALGWQSSEAPRLFSYDPDGKGGRRQTMSETFVRRFLENGGRLMARTRIDRLRRTSGAWVATGTARDQTGRSQTIEIRAERVFVACGAVQTPALLRRSGIRHNVGNSLRFHPMVKVVAEFDRDVNSAGDLDPIHQIKEFEPSFGMGCSISKPPMLGVALSDRDGAWDRVRDRARRMGIYYVQSTGGTATVRNLPGFADPLVRIGFSDSDLQVIGTGLRKLCEALRAADAVRVMPCVAGYPDVTSRRGVDLLPANLNASDGSVTSVHVFSSCPMGENERRTAANSFGKVHGTDGLYIADASLLCTPTVVNPQGTVMGVAHRNVLDAIERRFC